MLIPTSRLRSQIAVQASGEHQDTSLTTSKSKRMRRLLLWFVVGLLAGMLVLTTLMLLSFTPYRPASPNDYNEPFTVTEEEKLLARIKPNDVIISDFDETILNGDITFGTPPEQSDPSLSFLGMMHQLEQASLGPLGPGQVVPTQQQLYNMFAEYPEYNCGFNIALFAGRRVSAIKALAVTKWAQVYKPRVSTRMWTFLQRASALGAKIIIVTASPTIFLQGLIDETGWRVIGVDVNVVSDPTSSTELVLTSQVNRIPLGSYKREIVKRLIEGEGLPVRVGFGNIGNANDNDDSYWLTYLSHHTSSLAVRVRDELWSHVKCC